MKHRRPFAGLAALLASLMLLTSVPVAALEPLPKASASDTRIRVDLNAADGRQDAYTNLFENWIVQSGTSASATYGGVTFTLSNGGTTGGGIKSSNSKTLIRTDMFTPTLTMDGVLIDDASSGGTIKLEISGLPAGEHTLTTYHSFYDNVSASSMSVTVDGQKLASGIKAVSRVTSDADASEGYVHFTTQEGKTVTVLIAPEGNGSYNDALLNAFAIDCADPVSSISGILPADGDLHYETERGLNWTAGAGAVSHHVYFGESYEAVFAADENAPEYKGNQTGTSYALPADCDSFAPYFWRVFWRVDEVDADGNVTRGDVYSFYAARLAFPTAEGYGRYARGGSGGRIVEVTNLNDSGEGSLRQALEGEKGPRIVIFRVGGIIELQNRITIPADGGDVYVAGQTAPGDGICILKYGVGALGARDIIIRDLHVRIGDASGKGTDGMGLGSCDNCIVDHCSIAWGTDEGFSSRGAHNITWEWTNRAYLSIRRQAKRGVSGRQPRR